MWKTISATSHTKYCTTYTTQLFSKVKYWSRIVGVRTDLFQLRQQSLFLGQVGPAEQPFKGPSVQNTWEIYFFSFFLFEFCFFFFIFFIFSFFFTKNKNTNTKQNKTKKTKKITFLIGIINNKIILCLIFYEWWDINPF